MVCFFRAAIRMSILPGMVTSRIRSVAEANDAKSLSLLTNLGLADAGDDADEVTVFRAPSSHDRLRGPAHPIPKVSLLAASDYFRKRCGEGGIRTLGTALAITFCGTRPCEPTP